MKMIIEARLMDESIQTSPVELAVIDRKMSDAPIGMSLAEGKVLLARAQEHPGTRYVVGRALTVDCNAKQSHV